MPNPTTTYSDGGTHSVGAATGPVRVTGGTTVNFTGASITGNAADGTTSDFGQVPTTADELTWGSRAVNSDGSTLHFTGGTYTGGAEVQYPAWGGHALCSVADALTVSSGDFRGGDSDALAWDGLSCLAPAALTISGGSFTGGNGTDTTYGTGGNGATIEPPAGVTASVTSGSFSGGSGPDRDGYALLIRGAGTVAISGGVYGPGMGAPPCTWALDLSLGGTVTVHASSASYDAGTGVLTVDFGGGSQLVPLADLSGLGLTVSGTTTDLTITSP